ncbi:DUF397 domain-containing protein [Allosalinactinospora lopnorensis]|uniref:DUF397 domain-containing protein n=1 Tax=Allosalinactinospora lopnorensis TaxID=1352348 RepID=UPI000623F857|nr:DUF397 domain-containing protein [Allosalinactinospora lopnorensis]
MEQWHKSSYSQGNGGDCVEVAELPEQVKVRDTQNRTAGHLSFPPAEWSAFLADLRTDDL